MYKMLRDAGCNMISFGAQSAEPEILQNVHRRPDEAMQLQEAVKTANKLGMVTVVTYIYGLPGESARTAQHTTQQILKLGAHLMDAHVLEILPGSEIEECSTEGPLTDLSQDQLERFRREAFRRFYFNPQRLIRLLWTIARKNPEWFLLFPFRPVWAALRRNKRGAER